MSHPHPDLNPPPPLPPNGLRIVPLGGLGEIGRNMTVFEYGGRLLIVDCGVLFPESDQPGVDLILPDFDYLRGRLDEVDALVLTHAHEDHIGAVPYLLRERADIPLIGSRLTLALVASKLNEHRITPVTAGVAEGTSQRFGNFRPANSSRSTTRSPMRSPSRSVPRPGWCCTPATSRWTSCPWTAGSPTWRDSRASAARASTCSCPTPLTPRCLGSSRASGRSQAVLDEVFAAAEKRIIVACFATHVHRVQQVLDAAASHGRKVAFVGRSMVRNMGVARDLGYLRIPGGSGRPPPGQALSGVPGPRDPGCRRVAARPHGEARRAA